MVLKKLKVINYKFNLLSTEPYYSREIPVAYTGDLRSVQLQFDIKDMTSEQLLGSTAIIQMTMYDGSGFRKGFGEDEVTLDGNVFKYTLKDNEGKHSGVASVQLLVDLKDSGCFSSPIFKFEIINGLSPKAYEVETVIQDIANIKKDMQDHIDQFVSKDSNRDELFSLEQEGREQIFNQSEDEREVTFNSSQEGRDQVFNQSENSRDRMYRDSEHLRFEEFAEAEAMRISDVISLTDTLSEQLSNTSDGLEEVSEELTAARGDKANLSDRLADILRTMGDTTISVKPENVVHVSDFGAVGDGITDDTEAILEAFDSLGEKRSLEFDGSGVYKVSQTLRVTKDYTHIFGNGATILSNCPQGSTILNLSKGAPFKTLSNQNANMAMSGTVINNVSDTSDISPGDMVRAENVNGNPNYSNGHLGMVIAVTEDTIITSVTAPIDMPILTHIYVYKPLKNVTIEDLEIINQDEHGFGIIGQKLLNCHVKRVHVKPLGRTAIQLEGINCTVVGCTTEGFKDNTIPEIQSGRVGYGINLYGHNMIGEYNIISDSKHCLTSAHRRIFSTNIIFRNNIVFGTNKGPRAPLDFHGNSSGKFEGNIVHNVRNQGASIRYDNAQCIGNVFYAAEDYKEYRKGIYITDSCRNNVILSKNEFYGYFDDAIAIEAGNSSPTDIDRWWCNNVQIEGNIMEESRINFKTHGVGARILGNTTGYGIIFLGEEVVISDNTITDGARKRFEHIIWTQGASGNISGNIIKHTQVNSGFAIRVSGNGGSMIVKDNTIIAPSRSGLLEKTSNATAYFENNIWKKDDNTESDILDPIGISTALKLMSVPTASEKWRGQMILVKENPGVFPIIEFNVYAGTNIPAGEIRHITVVLDGKTMNWQVDSKMNTPELLAQALSLKKVAGWHWEATDVPKIVNLVADTAFKTLGVTSQGMGGSGANVGRKTLVSGSLPSEEKVLICKKKGEEYEWIELKPVVEQKNLKDGSALRIWHGTQIEYDEIVQKDPGVAYIING